MNGIELILIKAREAFPNASNIIASYNPASLHVDLHVSFKIPISSIEGFKHIYSNETSNAINQISDKCSDN